MQKPAGTSRERALTGSSGPANTTRMAESTAQSTAQTPRPEPGRERGALAAFGVVGLTVATVLLGALLPAAQPHRPVSPADDLACQEWGDGCRVCQRRAEGPACSLPGIACTPGAMRCLRRDG